MKVLVLALLVILLTLCPWTDSDEALAQKQAMTLQKVKPGNLSGIIMDSSGKKLEGEQIQVVDKKGKVVASALSKEYGIYRIKNVPEGEYFLQVGDRSVIQLQVVPDAPVSTLKIILPVEGPVLLPLEWTLICVGGTVVAVGVPAIVDHNKDSKKERISP
jgi:hypothetical protein